MSSVKVVSEWPGTKNVAGIDRSASSARIRLTPTRGPNSAWLTLTGGSPRRIDVGDRVVVDRDGDGQAGRSPSPDGSRARTAPGRDASAYLSGTPLIRFVNVGRPGTSVPLVRLATSSWTPIRTTRIR